MDREPKGKISTKNCRNKLFTLKTQILTVKKERLLKLSLSFNGLYNFSKEKQKKIEEK